MLMECCTESTMTGLQARGRSESMQKKVAFYHLVGLVISSVLIVLIRLITPVTETIAEFCEADDMRENCRNEP